MILESIQSTVLWCLLMLPFARNVSAHGKLRSYLKMNELHSKNSRSMEKSHNRKEKPFIRVKWYCNGGSYKIIGNNLRNFKQRYKWKYTLVNFSHKISLKSFDMKTSGADRLSL